jgi:hypothetical protein
MAKQYYLLIDKEEKDFLMKEMKKWEGVKWMN